MIRRLVIAAVLLAAACSPEGERRQGEPTAPAAPAAPAQPPAALTARIEELGRSFDGDVGIAVRDVASGWTASYQGEERFPQQSVFKTWVSLGFLDEVDRGNRALGDTFMVTRADLGFPYQPIAERVGPDGTAFRAEELIRYAITLSDNPSVDILMEKVGGAEAVQRILQAKGMQGVRVDRTERHLHAGAAELRRQLAAAPDAETRERVIAAWFADPRDTATANGTVAALAALQQGRLLSRPSTAKLIEIMGETETGRDRLQGGLPQGWRIAHKTGTGGSAGGWALGTNDVGLITAPDDRTYAVAVYVGRTRRPEPERAALMANVARAIVSAHAGAGS